jgi:hypothetical protein
MAGLVPAISLRRARLLRGAQRLMIEVAGTIGERSDAVLRTAIGERKRRRSSNAAPGNDKS